MAIKKVGVVGCGIMGGGIAQVCAQSGYQVVVSEINDELLNKGLKVIKGTLDKSVEKGKLPKAEADAIYSRLHGTIKVEDFAGCDLVIEAATENMNLKKKIFGDLERVCAPNAFMGTNTSCLSVIDVAMATKRPEKVLGMHFFNPVPVMKLLEIVTTIVSSQETLDAIKAFGQSLGKVVVIAKDTPAFIANRIGVPMFIEAMKVYEAGLATKEDIDNAMVYGFNHPMGPLALADLVGLDTLLYVYESMYTDFKDPKWAPPLLLKKMVAAGHLGRKTGRGFYDYTKK